MEKKEEKKGFWASLFAPKACSCCSPQIEEIKDNPDNAELQKKSGQYISDKHDSSCCR